MRIFSIKLLENVLKYKHRVNYSTKWNLKPPWSILFFGSDNFSLSSLSSLNNQCKNNKELIQQLEVVTTPKNNPVRKYAIANNLTIHDWPLKGFEKSFDIGLVVSFGHLIPENIINAFPLGMINVHASLLPRWRGAAPIIYALANGDKVTGISIMRIRPNKFDIGEVLRQESVKLNEDIKMLELHQKLADIGADNLVETIRLLPDILNEAIPQDNAKVTYAPKITSAMATIEFPKHSCRYIYNLSRALFGLYPLSTKWQELPVKLHEIVSYKLEGHSQRNGFVIFNKSNKLLRIYCIDGYIEVNQIGIANKKKMNANEFYNGYITKQSIENRIFK